MLINQKSLPFPRNLTLINFGALLIVLSAKINLIYLLYYFMNTIYCLLHLTFMTQVSLYLLSFLELI